mgnify:CR=1 FL=1
MLVSTCRTSASDVAAVNAYLELLGDDLHKWSEAAALGLEKVADMGQPLLAYRRRMALEIAQVVGGLLTVHVDQSQGGIVSDPVAVDLYMRARHEYHSMNSGAAAQSVELFERALARMPDEPPLLTGYALALARHWFFAGEGAAARATLAAERAVAAGGTVLSILPPDQMPPPDWPEYSPNAAPTSRSPLDPHSK